MADSNQILSGVLASAGGLLAGGASFLQSARKGKVRDGLIQANTDGLAAVRRALTKLDERLDALEKAAVTSKDVEVLHGRIGALDKRLGDVRDQVLVLEGQRSVLERDLARVEARQSEGERAYTTLKDSVTASVPFLRQTLETIQRRLDALGA